MNATLLAQSAYASPAAPMKTGRGAEYEAFSKVTNRLRAAHKTRNFNESVKALHDNRQLWTLLAVDVADPGNGLPEELRARIFYLAEFTLVHTSRVLAGTASPEALIEINRTIMSGLKEQGNKR